MPPPGPTSTAAPATPRLALRRNGEAVGRLARAAAAAAGIDLVLVSTNEVFDGRRTDGRGYRPGGSAQPDQRLRREQAGRRAGCPPGVWLVAAGLGIGAGARPSPGDRPDGVAVRPARQRLPGEDRPRGRAGPGGRRGPPGRRRRDRARRRSPPTWPRGSSSWSGPASRSAGIHHVVNGGWPRRGPAGRRAVLAGLAIEARSRRSRARPGCAPRPRRPGPSSSPRRCPRASRFGRGRGPGRLPAGPPARRSVPPGQRRR